MQGFDDSLKRAAFSSAAGNRSSGEILRMLSESREDDEAIKSTGNHLIYMGRVVLPHHPIRMRYLPYTTSRILLYGKIGSQEMTLTQSPEVYSLEARVSWQAHMCDCVQTSDLCVYGVSRSHKSAVISCNNELMQRQRFAEVHYPLGCLSSLTTNRNSDYLYGTNEQLNCVLRFTVDDLSLSKAERFGRGMWRPFDCCTSQTFTWSDRSEAQFLFVSNLDAGIFVFNIDTMEIVAECCEDMSPGAKYLTYDSKRSLLLVSSSYDRLLRCYKFEASQPPAQPWLHKTCDFLVANRKPMIRSAGPQCIMWEPETDQLAVVSWSQAKGQFMAKSFRVNMTHHGK